jgi:hypothetical protein
MDEFNNGIQRGAPEVSEERKALVTKIQADVAEDKKKWAPSFKRMRDDMKFLRKQLPNETEDDERAKINITQSHVKRRIAQLYAKDPTFVAKRRPRLDFAVWDGKRASLEAAAADMGTGVPTPETVMLLQDIQEALTRRRMLDSVGKTLEILLKNALAEQQPPFKPQCKQLVRRSVICAAGYLKISYQRELTPRPATETALPDITPQVSTYERLTADIADAKIEPGAAGVEEQALVGANLSAQQGQTIVREGLVYDFPSSLRIIPDRDTKHLAPGFPGARRVSEEFLLTCDQIKEAYGVDIGDSYTGYQELSNGTVRKAEGEHARAMVYETYDRRAGLVYVHCEGYPDFLEEPAPPKLAYLETFFPWIPLVFNPLEEEGEIFPEGDIRLLRPVQREINRKAEAIRQHRIASRPLYAAKKGAMSEDDDKSLAAHQAHDVIELEGLAEGQDIAKVFQPFPKVGVDPNLYETGTDIAFMQLIVGAQEANIGGTSGDSATESSIAENSRLEAAASEMDELDDFLSVVARLSGQVLLNEMAAETVTRVAGPGAVWPELSPQEIAEEIYLEIEAGSSGRPNRSRDLADFERAAPTLLQTPGIDPEWFAKHQIKLLGSNIDYEEAITAGLPSITSMNRAAQVGTGDPATDPNQQGGEGGANDPNDNASAGAPDGGFPAPDTQQPNAAA